MSPMLGVDGSGVCMEDNSWRFVNLAKNALSYSAAAKGAATLNPPGEARSGSEKSPGWIGELVRGLALSSQAGALIPEPFSDHRVHPFWIGLSHDTSKNTWGMGGNKLLLHVTDTGRGWLWSLNGRQLVEVGGLNGECLVELCSCQKGCHAEPSWGG